MPSLGTTGANAVALNVTADLAQKDPLTAGAAGMDGMGLELIHRLTAYPRTP